MKQYDVKISRMALSDMEQIYSYIADRLLESDTAMRQYDRIAEAIQSLNILPERCALVESEPERTQGLRQMLLRFTTLMWMRRSPMRGIKIYQVSNLEPMWMMKR